MSETLTRTRGRVIRIERITMEMIRENRDTIYCFEGCMPGREQSAKVTKLQQEPNTLIMPTKWRFSKSSAAYFNDSVIRNPIVWATIRLAFQHMRTALAQGRDVVIPEKGFGRGEAGLTTRAPRLLAMIETAIDGLAGERR